MKKLPSFLFPTATMLLLCNHLNAQNVRISNYSQVNTVVTVNGASFYVGNLYVLDSLDTQYNEFHTASFELSMGGNDVSKKLLADLLSARPEKPLPELVLVKQSPTSKTAEQRTYGSVYVKEIMLPEFNSASNELAKARITIQAQTVMVSDNTSTNVTATPDNRRNQVNTFKISIGGLPTQKVSRISNLKIIPGSNQSLYFTLDVASTDAKQWNSWLRNSTRGGKKEYGTITLFDASMNVPLVNLDLSDIEIVAISAITGNQDSIAKITVGLRAGSIAIR